MKTAGDKVCGVLPTDLSKAFDYICHYLLIPKIKCLQFVSSVWSFHALKMKQDYLQYRKQHQNWVISLYLGGYYI